MKGAGHALESMRSAWHALEPMRSAWHALAGYTALALVATWPLARGLGRDVAWDLGDPVFVMWALAWDCEQLLALLRGDLARAAAFFDANIFHPAPLTLAYSEHFIAQAAQILPIYAVTANPILCYNLLYLSTFVLSGLGVYLFVRELTGDARAAFIAGLVFAFAPYRVAQSSHLQVLSSQWMPFVFYGLRRYFDTRGVRPLAGAALALVGQALSSGYYLLYFSPFAGAYALWEIARRRAWRGATMWAQLAVAATLSAALTAPFLLPYAAVRAQTQVQRPRGEVVRYSADVYSYATTLSEQVVWGGIARVYPKPEGDLFPGATALLLAAIGLFWWRDARAPQSNARRIGPVAWVGLAALAAHVAAIAAVLLQRRVAADLWLFELRISDVDALLLRAALLLTAVIVLSPGVRTRAAHVMQTRGFFLAALLAAAWLSLGPVPQTLGRPLDLTGIYNVLYEHVPGFDGLRVPARFAMIALLMLAVLCGYGAAAIARWRWSNAVLAAAALAIVLEGLMRPFTVNGVSPVRDFNPPEARVYRPGRAPAAYRRFAAEPPTAVLAELPLGTMPFDVRATYYSIVHGHRVLNGYSGFSPPHYGTMAVALADVPRQPDAAWDALRAVGATHVLVHESAWRDTQGQETSAVLQQRGAVELFRDGADVLLKLP